MPGDGFPPMSLVNSSVASTAMLNVPNISSSSSSESSSSSASDDDGDDDDDDGAVDYDDVDDFVFIICVVF